MPLILRMALHAPRPRRHVRPDLHFKWRPTKGCEPPREKRPRTAEPKSRMHGPMPSRERQSLTSRASHAHFAGKCEGHITSDLLTLGARTIAHSGRKHWLMTTSDSPEDSIEQPSLFC